MKQHLTALVALLCIILPARAGRVGVYCYFSTDKAAVYQDRNIRARIMTSPDGAALLEVENLTGRVIYIDRGNSFSYVNGQSSPLFMPSSNTQSHTYGRGVIDQDNFDVQWVEGESHTESRTIYDQRILPLAPYGSAFVYAWQQLPLLLNPAVIRLGQSNGAFSFKGKGRFADSHRPFAKGDRRHYTPATTPLSIRANIEYSFSEWGDNKQRALLSDFVETIVIGSHKGVDTNGLLNPRLATSAAGPSCFAFRSGQSVGSGIVTWGLVAMGVAAIIAGSSRMDMDTPDWAKSPF